VQAMESGGELIVNVANKKDEENVTIKIIDSGTGINKKNLNQIFYPYFTTKPGGSGIGLAISQKIISDHHGVIKIESEPGQGTTVIVELPAYIK
jgi:signal transduction histidine kinase